MRKKVLSTLVSVVMVTSMLSACGSSGSEQTTSTAEEPAQETVASETASVESTTTATEDPQLEKTMKILSIWAEDNDNGVLINALCQKYKDEVNPNFNWEYELVSADDLKTKVATLVASNDLPDMFVYESGKPIVDLIEADKLVDMTEVMNTYGCADSLNPAAASLLATLSGTENIYDLPLGLNVEGFWYNKELFEKAGCEVPATWDEFEAVLKKLQDAGIQPLSAGGSDKWGVTRLINAYTVRTAGPDVMEKAASGEVSYTDPVYVTGAQKIQDWANAGYFGEGVTTVDMSTAGTMLCSGQAAIFYNGSWFTSNLNDESYNLAGEDGIGFFNVPVVDASISDENSYSMNCGNILCASKDKYDEATGWFLKYFIENMGDLAMEMQGSVKGYNYTSEGDISGYTQMVIEKINSAQSAFTWYEATMGSETSTVAQENVQTLLTGDMTAEEYMQSIQDAYDMSN